MKQFSISLLLTIVSTLPSLSQDHLTMRLSATPEAIVIDGRPTAYVEYFLTNTSNDTLELEKLVLAPTTISNSLPLERSLLRRRLHRLESRAKEDATVMPPGATNVLYLEPTIRTGADRESLNVLLGYTVRGGKKKENHTFRGSLVLEKKTPLVLGAPLREGTWAAIYEPSWERGHRRVFYKGDSGMYLPGRYAIDFIRLDNQGRYASGNEDNIGNWYGYGADVLAVSDGTVLSVRNNFPESSTLAAHHQPGPEDATGNYISLEVGSGRIVFYEHLKPGSIRVQPGQQVKKGDVIASLGFTGQSTGPHLHFHVADRNSALHAEGIPFVFERFRVLGAFTDMAKFGKEVWGPAKKASFREARPTPNAVVIFE